MTKSMPNSLHTPLDGELSFTYQPGLITTGTMSRIHTGTDIRIDGKPVGVIIPPRPRDNAGWGIALYVRDPKDKLGWRIHRLRSEFSTENDARSAFEMGDHAIRMQYDLHQVEAAEKMAPGKARDAVFSLIRNLG